MSEFATLHPYEPAFAVRYVAALHGKLPPAELAPDAPEWAEHEVARAQSELARAAEGREAGANAVSYGLARLLAATQPVFFVPGAAFTQLEARFDRGLGMLLRPPSRLFADAGLEIAAARAMPIRVDAAGGMMGGAYLPPALAGQLRDQLDARVERLARRMAEAEMDAPAYIGLLLEAAAYAAERGLGLYEASEVVLPGVPESAPPALRLLPPDRQRLDRGLRARLEAAAKPPREPGLLARLFGRGDLAKGDQTRDDARRWRGPNDVTPPPE